MLPFQYICIYCSKLQPLYVCCTETSKFLLFSANGKRTFVFLSQQTINSNRHLLFSANVPIYAEYK